MKVESNGARLAADVGLSGCPFKKYGASRWFWNAPLRCARPRRRLGPTNGFVGDSPVKRGPLTAPPALARAGGGSTDILVCERLADFLVCESADGGLKSEASAAPAPSGPLPVAQAGGEHWPVRLSQTGMSVLPRAAPRWGSRRRRGDGATRSTFRFLLIVYAFLRRRAITTNAAPAPRRSQVEGSGMGLAVRVSVWPATPP